jgi:molybdenum cofactor synthesis domain-containing protein
VKAVKNLGWQVVLTDIVPDDFETLVNSLTIWADSGDYNVILTTGGTGFSLRDVTPEATLAVIQRSAPGIAEAMRAESLKITPHAMLSRGVAGIRGQTLLVNLPGSPKAALENFEVVHPVITHAVQLLSSDDRAEDSHQFLDQ